MMKYSKKVQKDCEIINFQKITTYDILLYDVKKNKGEV